MPKPPRKKAEAEFIEVLELVIPESKGAQEARAVLSGPSVLEAVPSEPQNLRPLGRHYKPRVTTDINLVKELDVTFEVDQELGKSSFAQDVPNRRDHIDVQEEFVQEGGVGHTISSTEAGLSQAFHSHVYDPDPFCPFVDEEHKVPTTSTINVEASNLQDPSVQPSSVVP
ncbi:hypothetical protein F0562_032352 [Nyssa sinensis]|uniref:Uncharacterized protein n=1 Tax=Nyssa sinensis TaxID=561372 RepID=A0A5J5APY9_9ASTE|nr:hypothetical protein F0562_032352 [Nyssa sinensis]